MSSEIKPINKPLLILSLFLTALFSILGNEKLVPSSFTPIGSFGEFIGIYAALLVIIPLFTVWLKALWNEIVPRIFTIRRISYWEALGLSILLSILFAR